MRYRLSGSGTGNARSITAWIKEKTAVVPPIPKANVNTTLIVCTGERRNCRNEYPVSLMSCHMWTSGLGTAEHNPSTFVANANLAKLAVESKLRDGSIQKRV